jgi:hypothetical protein
MTTALATIAPTVGKLIRMLGSDREGEVIASAHALRRVLQGAGLDLHDLAQVIEMPVRPIISPDVEDTDWRDMASFCRKHARELSERERAFVLSMVKWHGEPSERQLDWLSVIFERVARGTR